MQRFAVILNFTDVDSDNFFELKLILVRGHIILIHILCFNSCNFLFQFSDDHSRDSALRALMSCFHKLFAVHDLWNMLQRC